MVKLEKQIERLENEKKDFDLVMEMEVSKYKRRESELTVSLFTVVATYCLVFVLCEFIIMTG